MPPDVPGHRVKRRAVMGLNNNRADIGHGDLWVEGEAVTRDEKPTPSKEGGVGHPLRDFLQTEVCGWAAPTRLSSQPATLSEPRWSKYSSGFYCRRRRADE